MLNKFFTGTFTSESLDTIPEFSDREFVSTLDNISIDVSIVKDKFCLKSWQSNWPDGISPRVLKEAAVELCIPLSIIFKKSLSEGKLPADWKVANIIYPHL